MISNGRHRPVIDYPCEWQYKLIGSNFKRIENAVRETLAQRSHRLSKSNTSARGRYTSANLFVQVQSETDRNQIYRDFRKHPDIKIVL